LLSAFSANGKGLVIELAIMIPNISIYIERLI